MEPTLTDAAGVAIGVLVFGAVAYLTWQEHDARQSQKKKSAKQANPDK
jgi:hypothetical protein